MPIVTKILHLGLSLWIFLSLKSGIKGLYFGNKKTPNIIIKEDITYPNFDTLQLKVQYYICSSLSTSLGQKVWNV